MTSQDAPEPQVAEHLFQLVLGYMPAISINVVTQLGVPDQLAAGPRPIADVARAVGANADALYRVMRALATVGIFHETGSGEFINTPASELLRKDHPFSIRDIVVWMADPLHYRCYANLMHSVKTGETVAEKTVGKPVFEYLKDDPEESAIFNAAMASLTRAFIPAVLQAYDFSGIRTLVDVGGGLGSVAAAILQKYPGMRGILFDLEHVVASARGFLKSAGVAERCEIVAGSFFDSVPTGGDAYVMKHIIHDWDDAKCITILNNIRAALGDRAEGRLLLLEAVVAPGNEPQMAKWADLEMLALPGGRERTEEQFRQLLRHGGFTLTQIVQTQSPACVIEARLA